jgi:8-oxo-dGTP diphosphatase
VFEYLNLKAAMAISLRSRLQMEEEINEKFGGKLRIRVCGILVDQNGVLMVRHRGLSAAGYFWAPPGGGMNFGQSAVDCLKQEFKEETGLNITVNDLLFVNEFRDAPLHAIELFFKVEQVGGALKTGFDPELNADRQIIEEVKYFNQVDFKEQDGPQLHSVFRNILQPEQLLNLKGYFHNWK